MNKVNEDKKNFFFDNNCKDNISKEKIILDEKNNHRTSISTNETFENDFCSDEEFDFNYDFFPKKKTIKFTEMLVDNWKERIEIIKNDVISNLINGNNILKK